MKVLVIGDATLYLGDCMDILPTLPKVDAVITDPPYGIGVDKSMHKRSGVIAGHGNRRVAARHYEATEWDSSPPASTLMTLIRSKAEFQAFFGGNYFDLPPSSCWLVWDKMNAGNNFADCELCWTNWPKAVRRIQHLWNGFARAGGEVRENHPTQKPLEVMKWVIELCPKAETILDPFAGSGTTGVAAIQLGRKFIGIEREPKYFDIACRRIEQAYNQRPLFEAEQPPKPVQLGLEAE